MGKSTDYVSNKRLRELIIEYNDINPNDNGDWLDKYERTMRTKGKYESVRDWIALRRQKYSHPKEYTPRFESVSRELFNAIYKIARRRLACFKFNPEEQEDLLQEIMLAVVKYINRYREDMNTSAFAYVTQIINNAIKLYLGQDNASRFCRLPWNTISDQCIALMYGVEENEHERKTEI